MEKRIFVDNEGFKKLKGAFPETSRISIWNALTYKTHSAIADKIRHVAMTQCGGVMRGGKVATLVWETWHDESGKTMVQTYGKRIKVVYSKETGIVVVYVDGVEKRRDKGLSIPEYEALQNKIEQMALTL